MSKTMARVPCSLSGLALDKGVPEGGRSKGGGGIGAGSGNIGGALAREMALCIAALKSSIPVETAPSNSVILRVVCSKIDLICLLLSFPLVAARTSAAAPAT